MHKVGAKERSVGRYHHPQRLTKHAGERSSHASLLCSSKAQHATRGHESHQASRTGTTFNCLFEAPPHGKAQLPPRKKKQAWSGARLADAGHPERPHDTATAMQACASGVSRIRQPPAANGIWSSRICNTSCEPPARAEVHPVTPNSLISNRPQEPTRLPMISCMELQGKHSVTTGEVLPCPYTA